MSEHSSPDLNLLYFLDLKSFINFIYQKVSHHFTLVFLVLYFLFFLLNISKCDTIKDVIMLFLGCLNKNEISIYKVYNSFYCYLNYIKFLLVFLLLPPRVPKIFILI